MALASSLQRSISKTLSTFGSSVTIRTITNGSYNTATGTYFEGISDKTIKAMVEDIFDGMGGKSTAKNKSDLNALIQSGDKKITFSAGDVTTKPTTKDLVIIDSVTHQIVDIKTQQAQGTDVSYELYVRN